MPARKAKTVAVLVNDAAILLQRLVRVKAALVEGEYITCISCGVKKHYNEMQGGHFISRVFTAYKLCEENIHPQCPACNGPRRGNYPAYTLSMIDLYGRDTVEEMLATKGVTKKYYRTEILEIIADLKQRLKEAEAQL